MNSRRKFIKNSAVFGAGLALTPQLTFGTNAKSENDKLNVGMIGVGLRGTHHLNNLLLRKDVTITAVCDIDPVRIALALQTIKTAGGHPPKIFSNDAYEYRNLLALQEVDAVIIATPSLWHTRIAIDAMKAGKFAGVEASASKTLEECWDLVNTHEQTGTHMMILEHVNYRRDVMAVLHMVRQNVFGELLHYSCGYQHDLREVKFNNGKQAYGDALEFGAKLTSAAQWQTPHPVKRNGDVYSTHGIGPIAAMADINRGNRFVSLSTNTSKGIGLHNHIVKHGEKKHPNAKIKFQQGDVIIETANGETIVLTHDTNLPRPYSLGFRVQGANGLWEVDGNHMYIENQSKSHQQDKATKWLENYDHPLWKKYGDYAEGTGHGGMDFFILQAFIEAAKQNVAPAIDVYDAAAWSSITPLSEISAEKNGAPQDFPDFTRGKWINRPPYNWIKDTY